MELKTDMKTQHQFSARAALVVVFLLAASSACDLAAEPTPTPSPLLPTPGSDGTLPSPTASPTAAETLQLNTWISHGPEGGIILALAVDPLTPTTLYAGASFGGVYKSTDSGGTWILVKGGVNAHSLAVDPQTPSTIYAGTWNGLFKSVDAGATWQAAGDWIEYCRGECIGG